MDSGILKKEINEIEQNVTTDDSEDYIDAQINILASVIIEILLKDIS
jgi:hypothetical protein